MLPVPAVRCAVPKKRLLQEMIREPSGAIAQCHYRSRPKNHALKSEVGEDSVVQLSDAEVHQIEAIAEISGHAGKTRA